MNRSEIQTLLPLESTSPEDTVAAGRRLAAHLEPGDVVALFGDLGAGKTHLVKGICTAFGIPEIQVTSPTFTLVNEYPGNAFPVYHFDAYRIKSVDEFFEIGYEDYFFGNGVCLIEWPERIESILPESCLSLLLVHVSSHRRRIEQK